MYPSELACLQANTGSPVDLMRIQNEAMCQALEENRVQLRELRRELSAMRVSFDRRTAVLSPAKAYSHQAYTSSGKHSFCPLSFIDILTILQSALRVSGSDDWDPFVMQSPSPSRPTASTRTAIVPTTLQPLLMPLLVHWKTQVSMKRKIMLFGDLSVHHLWYTTPPDHELKLISVCPQSRPSTSQVMPSCTPSSECS